MVSIVGAVEVDAVCVRGEDTGVDTALGEADVLLEPHVVLHRNGLGSVQDSPRIVGCSRRTVWTDDHGLGRRRTVGEARQVDDLLDVANLVFQIQVPHPGPNVNLPFHGEDVLPTAVDHIAHDDVRICGGRDEAEALRLKLMHCRREVGVVLHPDRSLTDRLGRRRYTVVGAGAREMWFGRCFAGTRRALGWRPVARRHGVPAGHMMASDRGSRSIAARPDGGVGARGAVGRHDFGSTGRPRPVTADADGRVLERW